MSVSGSLRIKVILGISSRVRIVDVMNLLLAIEVESQMLQYKAAYIPY